MIASYRLTQVAQHALHLGNARSAGAVVRPASIISNPWALAGAGLGIALQLIAIFYGPLREVLPLVPLDGRDWMVIVACAAAPAVAGQVIKLFRRA